MVCGPFFISLLDKEASLFFSNYDRLSEMCSWLDENAFTKVVTIWFCCLAVHIHPSIILLLSLTGFPCASPHLKDRCLSKHRAEPNLGRLGNITSASSYITAVTE